MFAYLLIYTTGWQFEKVNHLINEEIGDLVNEEEELSNLVDEEGGEAKDGLFLNDRANLLQAGHLQLPGQKNTVVLYMGLDGMDHRMG